MKKMHYVYCEDGTIEYTRHDGQEQYMITISGKGAPIETATIDLGGRTEMLRELETEEYEPFYELIKGSLELFEDMGEAEAEEHLENLSNAWGIPVKDLEYLR